MVHHYYRNVHAVVFVYDVTNLLSFEVNILSNQSCKITTAYIIFFLVSASLDRRMQWSPPNKPDP